MGKLPVGFGPEHPQWGVPSMQNKYLLMKQGKIPDTTEPDPITRLDFSRIPEDYGPGHPDWMKPSLHNLYVEKCKRADFATRKALVVRLLKQKEDEVNGRLRPVERVDDNKNNTSGDESKTPEYGL